MKKQCDICSMDIEEEKSYTTVHKKCIEDCSFVQIKELLVYIDQLEKEVDRLAISKKDDIPF